VQPQPGKPLAVRLFPLALLFVGQLTRPMSSENSKFDIVLSPEPIPAPPLVAVRNGWLLLAYSAALRELPTGLVFCVGELPVSTRPGLVF
jgi:hypothetical protein